MKKIISQFTSSVFLIAIIGGLTGCEDSKDENLNSKTSSNQEIDEEVKRVDLSSFFSQSSSSDSENIENSNENFRRPPPPHHQDRERNEDYKPPHKDKYSNDYDEEYKQQLEEEIQKAYYSNYFSKGVESDSTSASYNQPARPVDILPSNQQTAEQLNQERGNKDPRYSTNSATGDFPPMPPQMYSK